MKTLLWWPHHKACVVIEGVENFLCSKTCFHLAYRRCQHHYSTNSKQILITVASKQPSLNDQNNIINETRGVRESRGGPNLLEIREVMKEMWRGIGAWLKREHALLVPVKSRAPLNCWEGIDHGLCCTATTTSRWIRHADTWQILKIHMTPLLDMCRTWYNFMIVVSVLNRS